MSYHGLIPLCKQHLHQLKHPPSFLEVGVDRGVTFLTLVAFLARTKPEFLAVGVDVMVQEAVQLMLQNLDLQPRQSAYLVENNSLKVLPGMVAQGMKFDIVLLDGDHNYHTVSQELVHIGGLVNDGGVIVIDDYDGRWSERDLWYAERPGYESVKETTPRVDTEKHGVKPAVDDWLTSRPEWRLAKPVHGEPVILVKQSV